MLSHTTADRLRRQLRDIPQLTVYARMSLPLGSSLRTGTRTRRTSPGLPCREDILSLLGPGATGEIRDHHGDQTGPLPAMSTLNAWCELIAARRCATPALACRLLLHHHERAVAQDYARDYAEEIDALHRRLAPLAQARPRQQAVSRRCPHCDLLTLVAVDHCGTRCTNPDCGTTAPRPGALATA